MSSPSQVAERPTPDSQGWVGFAVCSMIWGSTWLVIAIGNDAVPPVWGATLRLTLASAILFGVMAVRRIPLPQGTALRAAVSFGFYQFGLNFPLIYLGERDVSSGLTAVIFATAPLSQSALAHWARLERMTPRRVSGALVALAGVALIFSNQITTRASLLGMLWILLATWCACLGNVALKRGPRQSPIGTNAVGGAVGAGCSLVWTLVLREPHPWPTSPAALVPILYLAVAGSVIAFVMWAWLLNRWDVSRASYIAVVTPLIALGLGAAVRHERVGAQSLAGAVIVLVGVVFGLELWRFRRQE